MLRVILFFTVVAGATRMINAACPNGWQRHQQGCYLFSHDREGWPGAYQMCEIMGGHLLEIGDSVENAFVTEQVKVLGRTWWIGLSDVSEEGMWVWMKSKAQIKGQYSNWAPNEPSTYDSNHEPENCANFYASGQWNDAHCTQYNYYICEKEDEDVEIVG